MSALDMGLHFVRALTKDVKRPTKLVVLDFSCWNDHPSICGKFSYLYDFPHELSSPDLPTQLKAEKHGTGCLAAVKCAMPEDDDHSDHWNLAPSSDVFFAPIPTEYNSEIYGIDGHLSFPLLKIRKCAIDGIRQQGDPNNWLMAGDIIAIPINIISPSSSGSREDYVGAPVVINPVIESLITELTCKFNLIIVIAAGNGGVDLEFTFDRDVSKPIDQEILDAEPNFKTRPLFDNRGISCGAIIAGGLNAEDAIIAQHHDADDVTMVNRSNYGRSVDVYAPNSDNHKILNFDADRTVEHIEASSGGTMWVAAALANIQNVRQSHKWPPYKPYEARAHLRQWVKWRQKSPSHQELRTPDLRRWIIGTAMIEGKKFQSNEEPNS